MTPELSHEPIAIIGIGCNFPGAHGPAEFWQMLCAGHSAIREAPPERLVLRSFLESAAGELGRTISPYGGFLDGIDHFDAAAFGISPREADSMDPQQRLLLEAAWEALEDAGITRRRLRNNYAGVFIGMSSADYGDMQMHMQEAASMDVYTLSGSARSILAGRISHAFDLRGPSLAVDTACSSSLVAVHLACQSIWHGGCDLALAGGVNVILTPEPWGALALARILSPDGQARVFDADANGFVRGEGVGIVVLKPLVQALADGDPVYAVILGGAINNDGRNSSVMAPNGQAQEAVLRAAYHHAGVAPGAVHYVEAHGTGTSVGDPIEARALGAVIAEGRPADTPCIVGSVKTNIGHLEAAAGISGLIKTALCIKHRAIPPSLHFSTPNPAVPWDDLPLVVQQAYRTWPVVDGPALAGVSSFGISGTNVHLVLSDAPDGPSSAQPAAAQVPTDAVHLLPLSAFTAEGLAATVARWQDYLTGAGAANSLADIGYTAALRRNHQPHRATFVGRTHEDLVEQFGAWLRGEAAKQSRGVSGDGRPVFVFSGQGAQFWPLDPALLTRFSVFREALQACADLFRSVGVNWSLLEELTAVDGTCRLRETDVCQAAIFACQVALAAQWRAWGIEPAAVVGHSLGEVAAAHVAGALTLEQAVRLVLQRGRVTARAAGKGAMALVGLSEAAAGFAIEDYAPALAIAAVNSPSTCVISGDSRSLAELLEQLTTRGVFARRLPAIDYAAHSPQMEPLKHELADVLGGLHARPTSVPFYSTVTATVQDGADLHAGYWAANLREPVRFGETVRRALTDGHRMVLEVHPTQVLLRPILEAIAEAGTGRFAYSSLQQGADGQVSLLRTLGALYAHGSPVDWTQVYPAAGKHVALPPTVWQKSRHWLPALGKPGRRREAGRHPFLDSVIHTAAGPGTHIVQTALASNSLRFLSDHQVYGAVVLPASAYVEIALEIAHELGLPGPHVLADLSLEKALVIPADGDVQLQVAVEVTATSMTLEYYSRPAEAADARWTLHARGTVRQGTMAAEPMPSQAPIPETFQVAADADIDRATHYQVMAAHGLEYGPTFQGIGHLWIREHETLARLALPETVAAELPGYQLHPVLLDLAFQSVAPLLDSVASTPGGQAFLPVALQLLQIHHDPRQAAFARAILHPPQPNGHGRLTADVSLLDCSGLVLVTAQGLALQELAGMKDARQAIDRLLYQIDWEAQPLAENPIATDRAPATCLVLGDSAHLGAALAARFSAKDIAHRLASLAGATRIDLSTRTAVDAFIVELRKAGEFPDIVVYLGALVQNQGTSPARRTTNLSSGLACGVPGTLSAETLYAAPSGDIPTGEPALIELLHLVQALLAHATSLPRLWIVTRGAQPVDGTEPIALDQTALWGLARSIALEAPGLRCSIVDLETVPDGEDAALICREVLADDVESQLAYRCGQRFVARLVRNSAGGEVRHQRPAAPDEAFRLETSAPGILDHLALAATERVPPTADQVEIRVHSAGLNFLDVLTALGLRPDQSVGSLVLGMECAGTVTKVGSEVTRFKVGDAVLAVAPHSMGTYTRTLADFVVHKPQTLSFQEAASVPIAYLTAYYALHTLGRIRAGERILIHAGAGGVGLAAVHLARRAGAEIFATAGSQGKRASLQELGVDHVMDSRTLEFADEVLRLTNGEGVDLVLNSLAGDAIPKGLSTLRANGRFLEIGKRDIYGHSKLDLALLKRNAAFFAIDLIPLLAAQPETCREMLADLSAHLAGGELPPLPVVEFPIGQAEEAFRHMAQAKHTGKIVLTLEPGTDNAPVQIVPRAPGAIRASGTYLISGGLGGLGLRVARWLVAQGARHLVLVGRNAPTLNARQEVAALTAQGARIVTVRADVSQEADVRALLEQTAATMPPLCGIFHTAGVLDDGLLLHLDATRLRRVMASKVDGAWLLHRLTLHQELDMFVLFSSATSVLGAPGQANYAAANAFLDGLAHYRRRQGLSALAINWGAWAEVGMAARPESAAQLARQGILAFPPQLGVALLERCLAAPHIQMTALQADWPLTCARLPIPILRRIAAEASATPGRDGGPSGALAARLRGLHPAERRTAVADLLGQQLAQVLRTPVHTLDLDQPLSELGIDSLMTVELINRIETELDVTIPVSSVLQRPTGAEFTELLLSLLDARDAGARAGQAAGERAAGEDDGFFRYVTDLAGEAVLDPAIQFPAAGRARHPTQERFLLTGATGFVGAFLLRDLLRMTTARIHCLVRATDGDGGRSRLLNTLAKTFPGEEFATERIVAVPGDLAQARLGLPGTAFDQLAASIDLIIHSAAQVDWLAPYGHLKPANVVGTETLIRLAARRQIPIHYVSSLAVFPVVGNRLPDMIDERTSIDHGGLLYGGYTQSKWVAEKLLMTAQAAGLPGAVYRPSLVVGHSQTGAWHGNDIVAKMLRTWIELGMAPDVDVALDLTPVDYVSRAIIALLSCGHGVYHVNNPLPVLAGTLIDWLVEYGYPIRRIPYPAWRNEVLGRADIRKQAVLDSVGPLFSFQVSKDVGWLAHLPRFDNRHTREALDPLECPSVDEVVFRRYVDNLRNTGYLPAPR